MSFVAANLSDRCVAPHRYTSDRHKSYLILSNLCETSHCAYPRVPQGAVVYFELYLAAATLVLHTTSHR